MEQQLKIIAEHIPTDTFIELLSDFKSMNETLHLCLQPTDFLRQDKSHIYGIHGVGHITRTLFWAHILNFLQKHDKAVSNATLIASMIHDLGRLADHNDPDHGFRSQEMCKSYVQKHLLDKSLLTECLAAVEHHSKLDVANASSRRPEIWQTLKDADALERERLHRHNVNPDMLRSSRLTSDKKLRDALIILARELVEITANTRWHKEPCKDFVNALADSVQAKHFPFSDKTIQKIYRLKE
ncbi:putative HD superfamily hydrolase [Bacteroidales bacterium Barb4]|nr:putative HD superfamily hydrolase [Bacteroidales bacterium Barb4]